MTPQSIYFQKDFEDQKLNTKKLLKNFLDPKEKKVLIKIHFGEPGNKTAFFPKDIKPYTEALKELGFTPILIDTPVMYNSPRNTVKGYEKAVEDRGYKKIADFVISNSYKKYKTKNFISEVAKELVEAKNFLVISHIKGHACSGFGGAIKNLGMGGVSVKTKKIQHQLGQPKFVSECKECKICEKTCSFHAVDASHGPTSFNYEKCVGCSVCIVNCPHHCLEPQEALFDNLLAQAASTIINNSTKKTLYINVIKNVTQACDCPSDSGEIISPDLGILFGQNPVALDQASLDLVKKENKGKDVFKKFNHKDPTLQLKYAKKYTRFDNKYKIIEI